MQSADAKSDGVNSLEAQKRNSLPTNTLPTGPQNLRSIALYTYRNLFIFKSNREMKVPKQLWIDRHTYRPTEIAAKEELPPNFSIMKEYSAFLGTIHILDSPFLLLVDDVLPVCNMNGHIFYTISSISFIPFEAEEVMDPAKKKLLFEYIMYLRKLLSQGYYFSLTYDLTLSRAKQIKKIPTETRFQWNYELYRDFIKFYIDPIWQVPLIQGYIGYFSSTIASERVDYFLISRRSCLNSGTRYYARGLDDDANVANFVETEQLFFYKEKCCSHVQIRGSAPVFWRQKGFQAQIKLDRTFALTNHLFLKHMQYLNETYGYVICVNLMAKNKKEEQMITEAFETHIKANKLNETGYEYFDFHHHVKNQRFENSNALIAKLFPALDSLNFTIENLATGTLESSQQGVLRTNCLDCLDRTNFVQGKFAMAGFDLGLERLGMILKDVIGREPYEELDNANIKTQNALIVNFKNIWADNGDFISIHYTGTGSVISEVTRLGKRSFFGLIDHGLKTLNRYYNGSVEDKLKQDCLDFLLAKHSGAITNTVNEAFENEIKFREKEFSTYENINVYVVTWNLAGCEFNPLLDLKKLFDPRGNPPPDLIVVGFQEYIELNASAMLSNTGKETIMQYIELLKETLSTFDKYILVSARDLVGLLVLVFVRQSQSSRIQQVDTDKVKTGLAGNFGNKGAVLVKLHFDDTSLCFVNCHLEHDAKALNERMNSLNDIHQKAFQGEGLGKRRKQRIKYHDSIFLFGDLNFRLSIGNDVRGLIKNYEFLKSMDQHEKAAEALKNIVEFDQLKQVRSTDPILKDYSEGSINFLPTYKFDIGTDNYDTSKKQRAPAWTDRILWNSAGQGVTQVFYDLADFKVSDHKPVVSYFTVQVKKVDKTKKDKVIRQVYDIKDVVITSEPEKIVVEEVKAAEDTTKTTETIVTELNPVVVENPGTVLESESPISAEEISKTNGQQEAQSEN